MRIHHPRHGDHVRSIDDTCTIRLQISPMAVMVDPPIRMSPRSMLPTLSSMLRIVAP